jgi:large subunit ribosomal protein L13
MSTDAKTFHSWHPKANELQREWLVVDAQGEVLGRVATQIAHLLRGKHKPTWSPHTDAGDFVIVLNASGIRLTGRKAQQKVYYRHTNYPGGLKETPFRIMMAKHPTRVLKFAVKGMLPKTRLGRRMLKKLHIYAGATHPHAAQQPRLVTLPGRAATATV